MASLSTSGRNPAVPKPVHVIGAVSNLGIRPYDDGTPRGVHRAAAALREAGLVRSLRSGGAVVVSDLGDVLARPYRDIVRPADRPRNEADVLQFTSTLAACVTGSLARGGFPIVVGADCSVVLGNLLGARLAGYRQLGLAYLDAHSDFATSEESWSGSVASMCLALAVGRGKPPLGALDGERALASGENVALIGRRDEAQPWYGQDALPRYGVLDLPHAAVEASGYHRLEEAIVERIAPGEVDGFWIHVDADVLAPSEMHAVDSPERGGPTIDELAPLLRALARHPKALGIELTIYDPILDADGACARRLVDLLVRAVGP